MGYFSAFEMRRHLPEEDALIWHLQYNHYPPISLAFLHAVREALTAVREGDFDRPIELPSKSRVRAAAIVEQLHLEAFLDEVDQ